MVLKTFFLIAILIIVVLLVVVGRGYFLSGSTSMLNSEKFSRCIPRYTSGTTSYVDSALEVVDSDKVYNNTYTKGVIIGYANKGIAKDALIRELGKIGFDDIHASQYTPVDQSKLYVYYYKSANVIDSKKAVQEVFVNTSGSVVEHPDIDYDDPNGHFIVFRFSKVLSKDQKNVINTKLSVLQQKNIIDNDLAWDIFPTFPAFLVNVKDGEENRGVDKLKDLEIVSCVSRTFTLKPIQF